MVLQSIGLKTSLGWLIHIINPRGKFVMLAGAHCDQGIGNIILVVIPGKDIEVALSLDIND